jgi:hypothetical protein
MKTLVFTCSFQAYNSGDKAGFDEQEASILLSKGVAVEFDASVAEEEIEEPAKKETEEVKVSQIKKK